MTQPSSPRDVYRERALAHGAERERLEASSVRLGTVRFLAFLAAVAPWVVAELSAAVPDAVGWASVPLVGVFAWLVGRHRRLRARLRRVGVAEALAEAGVARLDRRWDDLPAPAARPADAGPEHSWAEDLDLYGRVSLRSLLGPVHTPLGRVELDRWLLTSASLDDAAARQAAVAELAAQGSIREAAAVEGALLDEVDEGALRRFLVWCAGEPVLSRGIVLTARVLPVVTIALVVADVAGVMSGWGWGLALGVQATLAWRWGRRLQDGFARASSGVPGLRRYHRLLAVWESCPGRSPLLAAAVGELRGDDAPASEALVRLERWLDMADARFSSLHPVLAVGLLWDLHVGQGLDAWRTSAGRHVGQWMHALGTLEALSAVATVAADHPEWAFPALESPGEAAVFEAEGLGHPLLAEPVCVRNDVTLGPPGSVLLVTGSNMSGKSTLLRSIGLAVVMAGLGAPVCARGLRMPGCRLFTSMRVQDSIEAGVSFFMAELERLATLLRLAPQAGSADPPLLYLVDEILQGTNSEERRVAGRRLVRHLLRRRALGAVTTHDLEFHRHPEIEAAARMVHFRESVVDDAEGAALAFDYRLRPGLATTRNALRLAERVGLTDPDAS